MITQVSLGDQINSSYLTYSLKVVQDRAIPDCIDGLKPSQRRLIHAMNELGLTSSSMHKKCARIVGETIGRFHPHSDQSCYDTLVKLGQSHSIRYPLIDPQGNFGSVEHPAAAMRYTEARLTKLGDLLLQDVHESTMDYIPNFDQTEVEPVRLPAPIPMVLVNGATGIAVGINTYIPSHTVSDVINTTIAYLKDPEITHEKLTRKLQGPDLPLGGIINKSSLDNLYETGVGSFTVGPTAYIERRTGDDYKYLVITNLGVQDKIKVLEKLVKLFNDKTVRELKNISDESVGEELRIVIQLKQTGDLNPQKVWKTLVRQLRLQSSVKVNMCVLLDKTPRIVSVKDILEYWHVHRRDVVTKWLKHLVAKARAAIRDLNFFVRVYENRQMLANQVTSITTKSELFSAASSIFTQEECERILNTPIKRLSQLDLQELLSKIEDLQTQVVEWEKVLSSHDEMTEYMIAQLRAIQDKFRDTRKTQLVSDKEFKDSTLKTVKVS